MTGNNTYTGETTVGNNSELAIKGNSDSSLITVEDGAWLSLYKGATINGDITNEGRLIVFNKTSATTDLVINGNIENNNTITLRNSMILNGDISGTGELRLTPGGDPGASYATGDPLLYQEFTGNNTYTGKTTVGNNAELAIKGNSDSSLITVDDGAWLSLYKGATINGDITNNGRVIVFGSSDPTAQLTVNGDITNNSNVTLRASMNVNGDFISTNQLGINIVSTLKVDGLVDLNSTTIILKVTTSEADSIISTSLMTRSIIKSTQVINWTGTWQADAGINDGYITVNNVALSAAGDELEVDCFRTGTYPFATAVMGYVPASVASAGEALDSMFDSLVGVSEESAFKKTLSGILYTPAAALPGVWAGLTGEVYSAVKQTTFKQSKILSKQLANRLFSIRSEENTQGGVWFDYINGKGKVFDNTGHVAADSKINGAQFGADFAFSDRLRLGVALSGYKSDVDLSARYGGTGDSTNVTLSGYGIYNFGKFKGLYALGRIGVGLNYTEVDRTTGGGIRVKPKFVDVNLSAYGELGYTIPVGEKIKLTPFIGLQADYLRGGSFSENDPTLGFIVDDELYSQTSGVFGIRAEAKFNRVKLYTALTHMSAFNDESLGIQARYAGDPTKRKYDLTGLGLAKNITWIGIGADFAVKENFTINLNYDTAIESSKTTDRVLSLGFRYKFK